MVAQSFTRESIGYDHGRGQSPARIDQATLTEASPTPADAHSLATNQQIVPPQLLDGGEIVILAIKPSLWSVVFMSARWLIAMVAIIVLARYISDFVPQVSALMMVKAALVMGAARIGFGLLQWVSRLYILTNRRVMRLTGILNVDLFECPLVKIQNTYLTLAWYERLTRLGTISFATAGSGGIEASWLHVNNPFELHERLRSAIHRAQGSGNP